VAVLLCSVTPIHTTVGPACAVVAEATAAAADVEDDEGAAVA
jgi:hypothetical protein